MACVCTLCVRIPGSATRLLVAQAEEKPCIASHREGVEGTPRQATRCLPQTCTCVCCPPPPLSLPQSLPPYLSLLGLVHCLWSLVLLFTLHFPCHDTSAGVASPGSVSTAGGPMGQRFSVPIPEILSGSRRVDSCCCPAAMLGVWRCRLLCQVSSVYARVSLVKVRGWIARHKLLMAQLKHRRSMMGKSLGKKVRDSCFGFQRGDSPNGISPCIHTIISGRFRVSGVFEGF